MNLNSMRVDLVGGVLRPEKLKQAFAAYGQGNTSVDELRRRIDDAAGFLPLEQLALSPQCGFASSIRGSLLSEDEQFRKLDVMLETAAKVSG